MQELYRDHCRPSRRSVLGRIIGNPSGRLDNVNGKTKRKFEILNNDSLTDYYVSLLKQRANGKNMSPIAKGVLETRIMEVGVEINLRGLEI